MRHRLRRIVIISMHARGTGGSDQRRPGLFAPNSSKNPSHPITTSPSPRAQGDQSPLLSDALGFRVTRDAPSGQAVRRCTVTERPDERAEAARGQLRRDLCPTWQQEVSFLPIRVTSVSQVAAICIYLLLVVMHLLLLAMHLLLVASSSYTVRRAPHRAKLGMA